MKGNPYWAMLLAMAPHLTEELNKVISPNNELTPPSGPRHDAAVRTFDPLWAYVVFVFFVPSLAALAIPTLLLIVNTWHEGHLVPTMALSALIFMALGYVMFQGVAILERRIGVWKRLLPYEEQSISRLRLAGLHFYPARLSVL